MEHVITINHSPEMLDIAEGLELIETTLLNNIAGGDGPGDTGGGSCLLNLTF